MLREQHTNANSDRITVGERSWLVDHLEVVHRTMNEIVHQMSVAQWLKRPSQGAWSPSEIVEHTLLVDEEILGEVQQHTLDEPRRDWQQLTAGRDAVLKRYLPDIGRAQANTKTSTFRGLQQQDTAGALAKSFASYVKVLDQDSQTPLKPLVWLHPGMGHLNAYQWLLYIPLHAERHLNQLLRLAEIAERIEWSDPKHRRNNGKP